MKSGLRISIFGSNVLQIALIGFLLQSIITYLATPIIVFLLLVMIGSYLFTSQPSLVSRLILSFVMFFTFFVVILLLLAFLGIPTLSSRQQSIVFISLINLAVTLLAILRTRHQRVVFSFSRDNWAHYFGVIFLLPFVILSWFGSGGQANLWAYIGWDRSGQHLAQVLDLNAKGTFFYEFPQTLYPRAFHSVIAQFNALTISPSISPQDRLNQTFELLIQAEWLGATLTLILLLLIFKELALKFNLPAFPRICGSVVVGWIYSSDQFLLVPFHHGWSASIVGAWLCLLAVWGFLTIEDLLNRFIFLSAISMLTVHTWTLVLPFVGLLQLFVIILLVRSTVQRTRKRIVFLVVTVFFEMVCILPLVSVTFEEYANTTAFNAKNFVPVFYLPLQIALILFSLLISRRLRRIGSLDSYLYLCAVTFGVISTYFFAISIQSPLVQLYYYPAKLLWTYLLLLTPLSVVSLAYFSLRIFQKLEPYRIYVVVLLIFALFASTIYSARYSWIAFSNQNVYKSKVGESFVYPAANKLLLRDSGVLNKQRPIVIWNADGFDYVNSYWIILSGHLTVSPSDANDQNYEKLCLFLGDYPETVLISKDRDVLLRIREMCDFEGESYFYNKSSRKLRLL